MSGQLLELLIFAAIAFFIINKLIATLGSTSEDEKLRSKSIFKNMQGLKDVTNTTQQKARIFKPKFPKIRKNNLKGLVVPGTENEVEEGLAEVNHKLPNFNIINFIKGAKSAFKMILEASTNGDESNLEELVDKRYIGNFKEMSASYGQYSSGSDNLSAQISEIYMFGNNIFVKILFVGQNITNKIKDLHEEWTFTRSLLNDGPNWYLTNIDRPQ